MVENSGTLDTITTLIGGLVSAIIAGALALRKMKPVFAKDDLAAKAAEADIGVIERLERECNRMSAQNDTLANSLNQFQLQLVTFHTENQKLAMENNALKEENLSLREEIIELKREISDLTKMVMELERRKPDEPTTVFCEKCQARH